MDKKPFVILLIVLVAVLLVGQVLAYVPVYRSDSDAWADGGGIGYSVDTNTSSRYAAVLLDNNDLYDIEQVIVYHDPDYPAHHSNRYLEEKVSLTVSELVLRNSPKVTVANASETRAALLSEVENGTYRTALLMMTGVFPNTIYNGTADCPIIKWLEGGGVLYWIGDPIGRYFADEDNIHLKKHHGYGNIFFGLSDDVVAPGKVSYASDMSADAVIASSLDIYYNITSSGLDASRLSNYISIGYTEGSYDSIVLTKFHSGDGMIVVLGGYASSDAAPVIAQMICSKINYSSSLTLHEKGSVYRGTVTGSIPEIQDATDLYIYLGTPLVTYAKVFEIKEL